MKNKKIWTVGLCGAICLSLVGFTYANVLVSEEPKDSTSETENTSGVDILYQDTDGGQISTDGKNWISEADYEKSNAAPDVQWWTAEEYRIVSCSSPSLPQSAALKASAPGSSQRSFQTAAAASAASLHVGSSPSFEAKRSFR